MYEIFGNFDSVEEINACASGLMEEGDAEHIRMLAKENGIPEAMAEDYIGGRSIELTDWMNAAMGKLDIEGEGFEDKRYPIGPTVDYLKTQCVEETFARKVRNREKSVKKCMDIIKEKCMDLQRSKGVYYAADMQVFRWARDYFMEG